MVTVSQQSRDGKDCDGIRVCPGKNVQHTCILVRMHGLGKVAGGLLFVPVLGSMAAHRVARSSLGFCGVCIGVDFMETCFHGLK